MVSVTDVFGRTQVVIFPTSGVFKATKEFVYSNEVLIHEVGAIQGVSFLPFGGYSFGSEKNYASMAVILKGDEKYHFHTVFLFKENGEWEVYAMD